MTCPTGTSLIHEAYSRPIPSERRSKVRYPLELQVRYRSHDPKPLSGVGQVLNMSSSGLLVASRHELSVGSLLEVRIEWPSLLEQRIPLQLVAVGQVVRCGPSSFAVLFRRHQFRTMRVNVQPVAASVCDSIEQTAEKAAERVIHSPDVSQLT